MKTKKGKFGNRIEYRLNIKHLRRSANAEQSIRDLSESQGNPDILIIAAQFGMRHRGRSVRRVRALMDSGEFGLSTFAICCMLLTHPERLRQDNDLCIDCAGDEFRWEADAEFSEALFMSYDKCNAVSYTHLTLPTNREV